MCPDCGEPSSRMHIRYARSLSDLPAHGRLVRIALTVRRFRCGNERCPKVLFAERFGDDTVARRRPSFFGVLCRSGSDSATDSLHYLGIFLLLMWRMVEVDVLERP